MEKRIDPDDGKAYTWEEFSAFYKGTYAAKKIETYWDSCAVKGNAKAKAKAGAAEGKGPVRRFRAGDEIPDVSLHKGFPPEKVSLSELCKDKLVVLVGLPGAFTPTWSTKQVPGYLAKQDELKAKGVAEVIVFCVNDGAVMTAWAEELGVKGSMISFFGDPGSEVTQALGLALKDKGPMAVLGNHRCKRFSMLIESGIVKSVNVAASKDDPAGDEKPDVALVEKILDDCDKLAASKGPKPPTVKIGETIPEVELDKGFPPEKVALKDFCQGKKVVLVGLPGAFTPTWSSKQVPGYLAKQEELKAKGVSDVLIFCVNDGAVMKAWAKKQAIEGSIITFVADPRSVLTRALGLALVHEGPMSVLGNPRCQRFSMLLDDGVIKSINVAAAEDDPAGDARPEVACVDKMLEDIAAAAAV